MEGDYGYGMAEFLQYMMASGPDAQKYQAKGTNNFQDIMQLFFDPRFAAMGGTYDPTLLNTTPSEQQIADNMAGYAPYEGRLDMTSGYIGGSDPLMHDIADGLQRGTLNVDQAYTMLADRKAGTEDDGRAYQTVDAIWDEIQTYRDGEAAWQKDAYEKASAPIVRDDVFSKAGLPQPGEVYTKDTLPMSAEQYGERGSRAQALQDALAELEGYTYSGGQAEGGPPAGQRGGRRGSPSLAGFGSATPGAPQARTPVEQVDSGMYEYDMDGNLIQSQGGSGSATQRDGDVLGNLVRFVKSGAVEKASTGERAQSVADGKKKQRDPKRDKLVAKASTAQNRSADMEARAAGMASSATGRGRTPLSDAMQAKMAMFRSMGLI